MIDLVAPLAVLSVLRPAEHAASHAGRPAQMAPRDVGAPPVIAVPELSRDGTIKIGSKTPLCWRVRGEGGGVGGGGSGGGGFDRFLEGATTQRPELDGGRPWLGQIARFAAEGKHVSRVRVLDEPPSDYQRWELWAAQWHAEVGE